MSFDCAAVAARRCWRCRCSSRAYVLHERRRERAAAALREPGAASRTSSTARPGWRRHLPLAVLLVGARGDGRRRRAAARDGARQARGGDRRRSRSTSSRSMARDDVQPTRLGAARDGGATRSSTRCRRSTASARRASPSRAVVAVAADRRPRRSRAGRVPHARSPARARRSATRSRSRRGSSAAPARRATGSRRRRRCSHLRRRAATAAGRRPRGDRSARRQRARPGLHGARRHARRRRRGARSPAASRARSACPPQPADAAADRADDRRPVLRGADDAPLRDGLRASSARGSGSATSSRARSPTSSRGGVGAPAPRRRRAVGRSGSGGSREAARRCCSCCGSARARRRRRAPAAATNECRGLLICVPVAGPVGRRAAEPARAAAGGQFQLSCPRGYVVGGLDAELSDRGDRPHLPRARSAAPSTRGSRRRATPSSSRRTPAARLGAPSFRPHLGCMPATGGGGPRSRRRSRPGRAAAATRPSGACATSALRPGTARASQRVRARGERLVGGLARGRLLHPRPPPAPALAGAVTATQRRPRRPRRRRRTSRHAAPSRRARDRPGRRRLRRWRSELRAALAPADSAGAAAAIGALPARRAAADALRDPLHEPRRAGVGRRRRALAPLRPPALFLLALAALCVGFARPHARRSSRRTARPSSSSSTSPRSMEAYGRQADASRRGRRRRSGRSSTACRSSVRVGLIAFAGDPQVAAPPTDGPRLVREALDYAGVVLRATAARRSATRSPPRSSSRGRRRAATATGQPIATSTRRTHEPVSILFLSDGAQTRGELAAARGRRACEGGRDPGLHDRARDAERPLDRAARRPSAARTAPSAPARSRPARSADPARDRRRRPAGSSSRRNPRRRCAPRTRTWAR